ncbi:hypothetical protein NMY22_g10129 [Coprinellus aureogranulatus]|nr:hypothetical protein NMY22_g10129 [Coprinellus aureogranulatus]
MAQSPPQPSPILKSLSASFDSPSSSVFDLPSHAAEPNTPARLTPLPPPTSITQVGNLASNIGGRTTSPASYIVISGGTGGNAICTAFGNACFILPVSDDGGSSSEIIRVLGGPSVGDIRSRLVRLIPYGDKVSPSPLFAIRNLLAYRLPAKCTAKEAREEWRDIVEGRSSLWKGIPNDRKETIRGFLVYFESKSCGFQQVEIQKLKDVRISIGNYFLAAAQGFFRSLPSAIFLFSSITNSQAHILPVIVTNHTVTIAAELEDGERLIGQCEISHPVTVASAPVLQLSLADDLSSDGMGSLAELQPQNIMYEQDKDKPFEPLPARISKLYYINSYGMEIHPSPNPDFLANLKTRDVLVYSCGSLWTSIMPCLALRGVAAAIASSRSLQAKVLLLNAENDRETQGYSAVDYINAIVRTLNANYCAPQYGLGNANTTYPASAFITDLVYLRGSKVNVNEGAIRRLGIKCIEVNSMMQGNAEVLRFDAETVRVILAKMWAEAQEGNRTP